MHVIENEFLEAGFLDKGAEWRSLHEKVHGTELLWQADPTFWAKSAPLLFPIVGSLKGGCYTYEGHVFSLGRHGFARDRDFKVVEHEKNRILFRLDSDETTRTVYPFDWTLEVEYRLAKKVLATSFRVTNRGQKVLPFSIGAHPAFRVPLTEDEAFEDYWVEFELQEPFDRWLLNSEGLFSGVTYPLPTVGKTLKLTRSLFSEDAVVLKRLKSSRISLRNGKNSFGISMEYPGFSYLGVWTAPNAPFVCLEPWCGLADSADASGRLEDKEGIQLLPPDQVFQRTFAVTVEGI